LTFNKTTTSVLREQNSFRILDFLYKKGVTTRTALSKELNLSLPTVLRVIQPYMNDLLSIRGKDKSIGGRRADRIFFNYSARKIAGIQIERDFFIIVISTLNRTPLIVEKVLFNCKSPSDLSKKITDKLLDYAKSNQFSPTDLEALTIAVAGVIDEEKHSIAADFPLEWKNIFYDNFFGSDFRDSFPKCKVVFENDANALAVGEYTDRKMTDESLIALYFGQGIGAGVVINGKLYKGDHGQAGEIGRWVPIFNGKDETFESYFEHSELSKKIQVVLSVLSDLIMLFDPSKIILAGNVEELYEGLIQNLRMIPNVSLEKSIKKDLAVVNGALAISANEFIKKVAYKVYKRVNI
jgi:predicted NBD/HSP70 family sugar kinase